LRFKYYPGNVFGSHQSDKKKKRHPAIYARADVLTAVSIKLIVFWDVNHVVW
jgi:hypothetical protein